MYPKFRDYQQGIYIFVKASSHKAMEREISHNTLDGGPDTSKIYFSQCIRCKHFEIDKTACKAFPSGIPDEILYEGEAHDRIHPKQTGSTTFTRDF